MIGQFSNQEDLTLTDLVRHNIPKRFQTVTFYVRVFAMYITPVVLSPLLRAQSYESHCAFVVLYVLFLWLFQSMPPAIVSWLPLILVPAFVNIKVEDLLVHYTSETMLLYIWYAMVLNGIEGTNLHKRLILTLLLVFGGKSGFIIGGFVTTTVLVSMWTNGVRTAAIVLPIAMEAIQHIQDNRLFHVFELRTRYVHKPVGIGTPIMEARYLIEGGIVIPDVIRILNEFFTVRKGLLIGISYSAVLGSMGSVVGCGGNLFVKAFMEDIYDYHRLTMYNWFLCHMPLTVLCTLLLWLVLSVCYSSDVLSSDHISKRAFEDVIYRRFAELGPITYTELVPMVTIGVMGLSIVCIHYYSELMQMEPHQTAFYENVSVFFAFVALYSTPTYHPAEVKRPPFVHRRARAYNMREALKKISWAFVITMGAGICVTRLMITHDLLGHAERFLPKGIMASVFGLQAFLAGAALLLAEINNSLNNIIIFAPLICFMSDIVKVHPMYLLMPFIFCSYFGFLAATATPVSEFVADFGDLQDDEFLLPGFAMKVGCTLVVLLAYNTWCWDYLFLKFLPPPMRQSNGSTHSPKE